MAAPIILTDDVPGADTFNNWFVNINFAYKSADETVTSNTTVQDDNHLTLSVDSSTTYIADLMLFVTGATAGDIKWQLTGPAGSTFQGSTTGPVSTAADGTTPRQDYFTLAQTNNHGTLGASTFGAITGRGVLVVGGTAGSLTVQWAQLASSGTATTVRAGSYLRLTRVA